MIFTVSQNYEPLRNNLEQTYGRILVLNKGGEKVSEEETDSAVVGQVVSLPGLVITASLSGTVKQFGSASRLSGPVENSGTVRILSWRQR